MGNSIVCLPVVYHSNILIGDKVYIWGGYRPGIPLVHDSPQKRLFTSSITVYNILQSSLDTRQTTGISPCGIITYSSCCIGEDIYYFGGSCNINDCFHNSLFVLNTNSYEWKEIDCDNGPMKKHGCGMIHFHIDREDYLLVIGGYGPVPAHDTPDHYQYAPHPSDPLLCYTNEVHIMCVSSTPGKWTVPKVTGSVFPPLLGFSINTLPDNKAIIFGGASIVNNMCFRRNDIFILTYSAINNSLNIQKIIKPADPSIQWPVGRFCHSSVSLCNNGMNKHHLIVVGGVDNKDVITDTWILSIDNLKWNKVGLPEVVSGRYGHSMTCFKMSANCVWLLLTGGFDASHCTFVHSNIVELAFSSSDSNWRVSKIMNENDLKNKAQYTKLVSDCLLLREKEYQLMIESTVPTATTEPGLTGGGDEQVELLKKQLIQKEEENQGMINVMCRNLEQKDQIIIEGEKIIQEMVRSKEVLVQQKDDIIRQKEEQLRQKEQEVIDLQCQLESRPWVIQDEEVIVTNTIIGEGSYGEVRVAVFRGAKVAAKRLHKLIVSRHNTKIFTREMELSSGIHHPNIIQFIGATRINNPILLYELMPISLHKRLQDDESLTHAQIVSIGSDICTALCYLHQRRPQPIIHRDISSPNVLIEPLPNDKWRAKLSDFGSANLQLYIKTIIPGNPVYAAPEALIPQHHSPAMDVYSFGILLTEMTLHRAPEIDSSTREQSACSIGWVEMRVIVLKCINDDRSQRLSSEQLLTELQKLLSALDHRCF